MSDTQHEIPDYVQRLLNEICKRSSVDLQKVETKYTVKPGDNWLGNILEINLICQNDKEEPEVISVIAKWATTDKIFRIFSAVRSCYEREAYMYNTVLNEYIKLLDEHNVINKFFPFAKCYKTLLDEGTETIVLQNMKISGYKSIDHRQSVDYKHASLVMRALGKIHALSFATKYQKPVLFEKFVANTAESFLNSDFREPFMQIIKNLGEQVCEYLQKDSKAYKAFTRFFRNPSYIIDKLVKPGIADKYAVIGHGDPQIRNILFKYENVDVPVDLCLLDWQFSRYGSPIFDVSYFIWMCTDRIFREKHYEQLLNIYYKSLTYFLEKLQCNPEEVYPEQVFQDHLKTFSVFGMCMSLWLISPNVMEVEDIPDVLNVEDVNTLVTINSTVLNSKYFTRAREVVEDFVKYGYNL